MALMVLYIIRPNPLTVLEVIASIINGSRDQYYHMCKRKTTNHTIIPKIKTDFLTHTKDDITINIYFYLY